MGVRQSANCSRERIAGHPVRVAQGFEQFALPRRALQLAASSAASPASVANQRSVSARDGGAFAREFGQRRGDHLAQRVVVVLRRPFEQLHHLRVDDRRRVDDFEHRP